MKNSKLFVLGILLLIMAAMFWKFWGVIMLFLTSAVLAYLLSPLVTFVEKKSKCKHGIAVAIVSFLSVLVLIIIISFTVPYLASQITALVNEVKTFAPKFDSILADINEYLLSLNLPMAVTDTLAGLLSKSDVYIASFLSSIASALIGFSMQLFDAVVVFILIVYFLLDGKKLVDGAVSSLPKRFRKRASTIITDGDSITWKYLKSKVVIAFGLSIVVYIGLTFIGVKYAIVFAILSFILDFIPYFGSIISGAIAVFFTLITLGLGKAFVVLAFVLIAQQIEGNVIAPKVQGELSGIHPITVMFAILACNQIWGVMGMFIAVPVAAVLKMIFAELWSYVTAEN